MFGKKSSIITTDTLEKLFDNKKEQKKPNVVIQEKIIVAPAIKNEIPKQPEPQKIVEKIIEKVIPEKVVDKEEVDVRVSFKKKAGSMLWL